MKSIFNRAISFLLVLFFCTPAFASKTALIYHSNYSDAHTNVKTQLEADGYTVTLSTTGTVDENLINSYDVVWDMKYNNSIGSNGKTRYQNFVNAGGVLVLVGENNQNFSNNNQTIEAFVENKLGGTVGLSGNTDGCAYNCTNNNNSNTITTTNTDVTDSDYGSDVAVYPYGTHFTGDGTWVAKNGNGQVVWMRWSGDELPSGYTGAVYITFDINQFESSFDKAKMSDMISDTYENFLTTTTVTITSSQTTAVNTAKGTSANGVDLNVNGDNNTVNIEQKGEDNFIKGSDWSSTGTITGDNNTLNVDQGNVTTSGNSGRNGLGVDITGDANTVNVSQGDYSVDVGDHRMSLDIDGSTNTLNLTQRNDGDTNSEHYMSLDLDSSQNVISMQQLNDGDKFLFLDVDNNNNTVDVNQSGDGSHYMDIKLGTGSYAHDVDISQTGDGNHSGRVDLDGYSTDFDLLQQGNTNQSYSVDMTCGTANGCSVSTTQGN